MSSGQVSLKQDGQGIPTINSEESVVTILR